MTSTDQKHPDILQTDKDQQWNKVGGDKQGLNLPKDVKGETGHHG